MKEELEMPPDAELLIRSAWLINWMAGQISNAAAQATLMTTDPGSDQLVPGMVEMNFGMLGSLQEILSELQMELLPQVHAVSRVTLDAMRIRVEELKGIAAENQLLKFMTEPELSKHLNRQLRFVAGRETSDTLGTMLVIFGADGICQYGSTKKLSNTPQALRELADRLEKNETVAR